MGFENSLCCSTVVLLSLTTGALVLDSDGQAPLAGVSEHVALVTVVSVVSATDRAWCQGRGWAVLGALAAC